MLDPMNVSFVLANEVAFCSLPEELQAKIQATVSDVLSQLNGLETELVTQASLTKVSVIYSLICLEADFVPLTEESQKKMVSALDAALELIEEPQPQDKMETQDSGIPPMFGMKVTKAIGVPDTAYDFEIDIPVKETIEEEDMQGYLTGILAGVEGAILDLVKDMPLSQIVVEQMYPSTRAQFNAGELTIGKLLQEQPSLIFVPVV